MDIHLYFHFSWVNTWVISFFFFTLSVFQYFYNKHMLLNSDNKFQSAENLSYIPLFWKTDINWERKP